MPSSRALLNRASVPILDSYLAGASLESSLLYFYKTHSPKFKDFKKDGEHSLSHTQCHNEFIASIESLIELQLNSFNIKIDDCYTELVSVSVSVSQPLPEATAKVVTQLEKYLDFLSFCQLMKNKFQEIWLIDDDEYDTKEEEEEVDEGKKNFVRVLWDVENVGIPRDFSGFSTCEAITAFLNERGVINASTDFNLTLFRCPSKRTISKQDEKELDRAAVEQIICSDKREDADRKLVTKLNREMSVLPPSLTSFVVISSDNDFTSSYLNCRNLGFNISVSIM